MEYITLHLTEAAFNLVKAKHARPGVALTQDNGVVHLMPTMRPIDLGLSVKWGEYNIGAFRSNSASTWVGNYYSWGEVETKAPSEFTWLGYKFHSGNEEYDGYTKYTIASSRLEPIDDAATYELGKGWRMPTKSELEELARLQASYESNYLGINDLNGILFEGNEDSIFIPMSGEYYNGNKTGLRKFYILSSELWGSDCDRAWMLYNYNNDRADRITTGVAPRFGGIPIRPVFDESLL